MKKTNLKPCDWKEILTLFSSLDDQSALEYIEISIKNINKNIQRGKPWIVLWNDFKYAMTSVVL